MNDPVDRTIDKVAAEIGAPYGFTASQVLQHIALGNVPHPDAPEDVCGATSPRRDNEWCRRAPGHTGNHCAWPDPCPTYLKLREPRR